MNNKEFKLRSLYFYISGGCNLKCKHCWIEPDSSTGDLSLKEVKEVIRQTVELGATKVKLTGGEPFLRTDIFQILEFMKGKGLHIGIETNGTFIQEKEARELRRLNIDFISVSIDSPDEKVHDEFRGLKGAFKSTIRGLKALKKAGFSPQVIASVYRRNIADIERLALFVQGLGAGSLKINPINQQLGRARDFGPEELLGVKELIDFESYIQKTLQPKLKIPVLLSIPRAFKKLSYIQAHPFSCRLLEMIGILSDGTISLCGIGEKIEELNMGHINKDRLRDIWENHKLLNAIRENIPYRLEGICGRCVLRKICLGYCRALAYYRSKSLTAPYYFCQKAYESGYFPKSRIFPSIEKERREVYHEEKKG